jgi:DNA-directed RNA polymerase alpha subunit
LELSIGKKVKERIKEAELVLQPRAQWPNNDDLRLLLARQALDIAPNARLKNFVRSSYGYNNHSFPLIQLIRMSDYELKRYKNIGNLSVIAMRNALRQLGLDFHNHLSTAELAAIDEAEVSIREWQV